MSSVLSPRWWQKKWKMWAQVSRAHLDVTEDEIKIGDWRGKNL